MSAPPPRLTAAARSRPALPPAAQVPFKLTMSTACSRPPCSRCAGKTCVVQSVAFNAVHAGQAAAAPAHPPACALPTPQRCSVNHISKVCSDVAKSVEFCELGVAGGGGGWGAARCRQWACSGWLMGMANQAGSVYVPHVCAPAERSQSALNLHVPL